MANQPIDSDWETIPSNSSDSDWETVSPNQQAPASSGIMDTIGNAIKQTPLGMVSQGANSITSGMGQLMDITGIPVSPAIQRGAQALFQPARAMGVGVANQMTGSNPLQVTQKTTQAFSPSYQPQNVIDRAGSSLGENAAVMGANAVNPILGAGAVMAQQAQGGKVSPLPGILPFAKPILEGAKFGAKKLFSAGTGVSEPAIDARFNNPAIGDSASITDLTQKLPQSLNKLSNQISEGDKAAWNTLSKSYNSKEMGYSPEDRAIPKDTVQSIIDSTRKELGVYGGGLIGKAAKQAASTLEGISEDINNVGKYSGGKIKSLLGVDSSIPKNIFLPETTVKGIIQSLDDNINWGDDAAKPLNSSLEKARISLDEILKKNNTSYSKAMEPVAEKMQLLKRIQQQFNIKSKAGEGFVPGTSTEGNLSNVLRNNKSVIQQTLADLKNHTGDDYLSQLRDAGYAKEFQPGMRAQGSRRTLFGGAVGGGIGHFTGSPTLGGMAGAGAGFMLDTQGGPIAGKAIDAVSKMDLPNASDISSGAKQSPLVSSRALTESKAQEFINQAFKEGLSGKQAKERARELAKEAGY